MHAPGSPEALAVALSKYSDSSLEVFERALKALDGELPADLLVKLNELLDGEAIDSAEAIRAVVTEGYMQAKEYAD